VARKLVSDSDRVSGEFLASSGKARTALAARVDGPTNGLRVGGVGADVAAQRETERKPASSRAATKVDGAAGALHAVGRMIPPARLPARASRGRHDRERSVKAGTAPMRTAHATRADSRKRGRVGDPPRPALAHRPADRVRESRRPNQRHLPRRPLRAAARTARRAQSDRREPARHPRRLLPHRPRPSPIPRARTRVATQALLARTSRPPTPTPTRSARLRVKSREVV
jgi:hypothetical protein